MYQTIITVLPSLCVQLEKFFAIHFQSHFFIFSELKRRLKAEQKAKEKLEKESAAQKKPPAVKKESNASAATKSVDISPNVKIENINIQSVYIN